MAGWKLRKDKAQAETPETTEDPLMARWEEPAAETEHTFLPATQEPTFGTDSLDTEFDDTEPLHTGGVIALGGESEAIPVAPLPDFEMGEEVSFDDDEEENEETSHAALIFPEPVSPDELPAAPSAETASTETASTETASTETASTETPPAQIAQWEPEAQEIVPEVAPFVMDTPAPPPAADLPHRLVMRVGRLSAAFEVTKDVTVIGRPDSSLHYYPDIEVEMDDAVSRRHAEVLKSGDGQYYLLDSGSTNGTRLNGETLPPNEERLLAHGDRIHLGERTEIIFE